MSRRRGTALLVGLLLTVTVSLLALSLLLGTANRRRRRAGPLEIETLLEADAAARIAQLDLAVPGRVAKRTGPGPSEGRPFDIDTRAPVLTGLSRGRGDLRIGVSAGWGEVWSLGVVARRNGEPRGRALELTLVRPAVPSRSPLRLAVAGGHVFAYASLDPSAAPTWEAPGTAAAATAGVGEGLYLRAGLPGYLEFRATPRPTPLTLVVADGLVRVLDGMTGRELFEVSLAPGRGAGPFSPQGRAIAVTGDAALGTGPCTSAGPLPPGCAWRNIGLAGAGRALLAVDLTSPSAGRPPVLWTREMDASVGGVAIGRFRSAGRGAREEGGFVALVTSGSRLLALDLSTGQTLETWAASAGTLSAPAALDLDGDAFLDTLYAADDHGRLFRFDLASRLGPVLRADTVLEGAADLAPAVLRAGIDPATGADRLAVAWVSGEAGGHVSAFVDTPARPAEPVAHPASLALDAPRLAACGELGPLRPQGWSIPLRPRESVVSRLVVLDGLLYFTTSEACAGGEGCALGTVHGRLYRLDALNGDPCSGVSCCGRSPSASTRGAALGRLEPETGRLGSVDIAADEWGRPALVVARAIGRPLVVPATVRPSVTAWREARAVRR